MSDEAPAEIKTRLYIYGPWQNPSDPPQEIPTELGARLMDWLDGKEVALDADLSRVLHLEFKAQDRFREAMVRSQSQLVGKLQAKAAACAEGCDAPTGPAEAMARGYQQGSYQAFAQSAQDAQDVINDAVTAIKANQ